MPDPDEELSLLEDRVRAAGKIALNYFGGDYKRWSKEGGSPVTEADLAVDNFLKEKLLAARPGYGWLSEESADDESRLDKQRVWIVDPIDGTRLVARGIPGGIATVALAERIDAFDCDAAQGEVFGEFRVVDRQSGNVRSEPFG